MESNEVLTSLDELESLVYAFETCSISPAEFSHRKHLAVCLYYLSRLSFSGAVSAMRSGLTNFLAHHQLHGYHETITLFWLKRLEREAGIVRLHHQTLETINRTLAANSDSKLIFTFYSRECVMSDLAKREWVDPDLQPLDA